MNRTLILFVVLALIVLYVFSKQTENFWSRPNKCFDCEKQITSIYNAHLAFPTKCFDCERNSKIPYFEGPSKCLDCDQELKQKLKMKDTCMPIDDNKDYKFQTYMRNRFPNRA